MKPLKMILNVAEKASVAKEIVKMLAKGPVRTKILNSKFNPVYEFAYELNQVPVAMRVTSVAGHVMTMEFSGHFRSWTAVTPSELFTAPISKTIAPERHDTVSSLKASAVGADMLALWLDCDREGENIAYEVIDIVKDLRPDIEIARARFSALTKEDIEQAISKLVKPDMNLSLAVDARQEIDLRLGAAFTRFQTEELNKTFRILGGRLISYGPCQFPTMGFVIKRFMEIKEFVPKDFWTLELTVERMGKKVVFESEIGRSFELEELRKSYAKCQSGGDVKIVKVEKKKKIKARPKPLATVPFQKLASSKLKIDSDTAMKLAEKLYNQGYISYPRTETDKFPATIDLKELIRRQTLKPTPWTDYAKDLLAQKTIQTRAGDNDDKSHPPIHPVKAANMEMFENQMEWKVFELITRHFLAACGKDAIGQECVIDAEISGLLFNAKGLTLEAPNYLKIYPYQQWTESELPAFLLGEVVTGEFQVVSHRTQPPSLLSEADLISQMDNSGIGTDSTIHLHIKTIQTRGYVSLNDKKQFQPTHLGLALYLGHRLIGNKITEPELRAGMEKGMSDIAKGKKAKETMVSDCLKSMKRVFDDTVLNLSVLKQAIQTHLIEDKSSPYAGAKVVCFKCKEPGHLANNCPVIKAGKSNVVKITEEKKPEVPIKKATKAKICPECGTVGRHSRNSTCSKVKRAISPPNN